MKLPSFLSNLRGKRERPDYAFALEITHDRVNAAVWYSKRDDVEVVGIGSAKYQGGWEEIISSADGALSEACGELPNSDEITRVVLGLHPRFVKDDKIVAEYLSEFKRLCEELSLAPAGFVVTPEALAYLLGKEDGVPQTAILVGADKEYLTISVFKVGKLVGVQTIVRTGDAAVDFEKAIRHFEATVEVLPSKIILYDGGGQLEDVREALLHYPWKAKSSFLHFPKIDILAPTTSIEAVAVAGAAEMAKATMIELADIYETVSAGRKGDVEEISTPDPITQPFMEPASEAVMAESPQMEEAEMFGFVRDRDVALEERAAPPPQWRETREEVPPFAKKPSFSLPTMHLPGLSLPKMPGMRITAVLAVLAIVLIGGILVSLYWTVPAATVRVLVDPRVVAKDIEVKLNTQTTNPDINSNTIPAVTVEEQLVGRDNASTTGKKLVGDPAKGDVTVYNKTTNAKTFPKGTVLVGPKSLQFSLDEEVTVASMSDVFAGIAGKASGKVTAQAIGTDGNLPPSSDFAFKDFPVTLYAARNEKALVGGTSREVQVVAKSDVDAVTKKLTDMLGEEARQKLITQLQPGAQLLPESVQLKVVKKVLSHEVGSEATQFETELTVKATGTTYQAKDIGELVKKNMSGGVPTGYSLDETATDIQVSSANIAKDGSVTFTASARAKLIPSVAKDEIKRSIVGKTLVDVEKILRDREGIVGFEVVFTKDIPFFGNKSLPKLAQNLTVEVQPR